MSRFKNKASSSGVAADGGSSLHYIRPADLSRANFEGVVAEGEFIETLPNQLEESKNDFKFIVDTALSVTGQDKDGEPYTKTIAKGDTVIVNTAGNLSYYMRNVEPGQLCRIVYQGKKEIEKGQRKGTLAHNFEVEY